MAALAAVDAVVLFDEDTPLELIRAMKPDVLVKGGDYTVETVVGHEDRARCGRTSGDCADGGRLFRRRIL